MVLFDGHGEPGRIADVRVPIQWQVGRDDDSASERVGPLRESLRVAGRRGEVHVYPGAARGFFDESAGGAYHPDAARQAWVRALAFFQTHLRSGS